MLFETVLIVTAGGKEENTHTFILTTDLISCPPSSERRNDEQDQNRVNIILKYFWLEHAPRHGHN